MKGKERKKDVVSRCSYLRKKFDINNERPAINTLRNNLVHFDERLEEWFTKSKHKNFMDGNLHELSLVNEIEMCDCIRNYDPALKEYTFFGESYKLNEAVEEVCKIKKSAERRLVELANIKN